VIDVHQETSSIQWATFESSEGERLIDVSLRSWSMAYTVNVKALR
jgi:hypothetical protein